MKVIYDLLSSEKAVATGALVISATLFVFLGHISFADWREYTRDLLGIYVAGKTISAGATAFASRSATPAPEAPAPAKKSK